MRDERLPSSAVSDTTCNTEDQLDLDSGDETLVAPKDTSHSSPTTEPIQPLPDFVDININVPESDTLDDDIITQEEEDELLRDTNSQRSVQSSLSSPQDVVPAASQACPKTRNKHKSADYSKVRARVDSGLKDTSKTRHSSAHSTCSSRETSRPSSPNRVVTDPPSSSTAKSDATVIAKPSTKHQQERHMPPASECPKISKSTLKDSLETLSVPDRTSSKRQKKDDEPMDTANTECTTSKKIVITRHKASMDSDVSMSTDEDRPTSSQEKRMTRTTTAKKEKMKTAVIVPPPRDDRPASSSKSARPKQETSSTLVSRHQARSSHRSSRASSPDSGPQPDDN